MEIPMPTRGLHRGASNEKQPVGTTPDCLNVRPHDTDEGRVTIGQRPGLKRAYSTQVSGARPIVAMAQITTVYVESA